MKWRDFSEEMRFEEAAILKRKYDLIENFRAKSEVVSQISYDIDVFSIESEREIGLYQLSPRRQWRHHPIFHLRV